MASLEMKPDAPIFDPLEARRGLQRSGYTHTPVEVPEAVVAEFCEENGLTYQKHFFNYTITPAEVAPETAADKEAHWEQIRRDNLAKRQRNAAARKKRETQTK